MVGRGGGSNIRLSLRVYRDSLIGDISDISIIVVRGVLNVLGATIGKSNIIRSGDNTVSISSLSSIEVSLRVVISNSVLVSVRLISIGRFSISSSLVDNRGSMDNWGMVDNWSSMDNWSNSMGNWVGNNRVVDSMGYWVGNSMSYRVGNNWVSNSMSYWVSNSMGNWVSNKSMSSMSSMGDNSTMSMANHMGRNIRGWSCGSKAKKSRNNESLHSCYVT